MLCQVLEPEEQKFNICWIGTFLNSALARSRGIFTAHARAPREKVKVYIKGKQRCMVDCSRVSTPRPLASLFVFRHYQLLSFLWTSLCRSAPLSLSTHGTRLAVTTIQYRSNVTDRKDQYTKLHHKALEGKLLFLPRWVHQRSVYVVPNAFE